MAQVKNSATGQVLTIPDDQVPFMSSQWSVVSTSPAQTTASASAQPSQSSIKFINGLSAAQKQSITNLVASKPQDQWTQTDWTNYAYATGTKAPTQAATGKPWVAIDQSGNIYANGKVVSSVGDANAASAQAKQMASSGGATYVGSFPAGYDLKTWASQNGYDTSGSALAVSNTNSSNQNTQTNTQTNTQSNTQQQTSPQPQSTDAYKTELASLGIDTSGLSDQQISWLGMMGDYQKLLAANDKNIAPPSLSPQQISSYLDQAKAELGPAYAAQLDSAKQDFTMAAANLTGDVSFASQQQQQAIKDEQKQQADQMAEAGLAYSGLRKQAEEKLKTTETGLVRSQASQYQKQLQDLAGNFQKTYGTEALNSLNIPALSYVGQNINYNPYNIAPGFGTAQQAEKVAEINRQNQLILAAQGQAANAQQSTKLQPLTSL